MLNNETDFKKKSLHLYSPLQLMLKTFHDFTGFAKALMMKKNTEGEKKLKKKLFLVTLRWKIKDVGIKFCQDTQSRQKSSKMVQSK